MYTAFIYSFFFFNDTATTEIYTLSLHDALPIWIRGTLQFDDAPLGGVLAQLERWYDLEIQTTDRSLERERLTISFTTAAPDEALSALARVLGARFTREERVVRLTSVRPVR